VGENRKGKVAINISVDRDLLAGRALGGQTTMSAGGHSM
jgi:hypothetical protein